METYVNAFDILINSAKVEELREKTIEYEPHMEQVIAEHITHTELQKS